MVDFYIVLIFLCIIAGAYMYWLSKNSRNFEQTNKQYKTIAYILWVIAGAMFLYYLFYVRSLSITTATMCGGKATMCGGKATMCGGKATMCGGKATMCGGKATMCGGKATMY